jgi:transposase-like protein
VKNREAVTLIPIIRKHILPNSIIYSDQWRSYNSIASLPENYQHFTVNHSKEFIDKRSGCNTNSVESIWLKCKSKIRGMCGVNRLYLQEYLDEVMWRHNECRVEDKNIKKSMKYTRRNAFKKMLGMLHVANMEKLVLRMKQVDEDHKQQILKDNLSRQKSKFNSDEFVLRRNRIKNVEKFLEDDAIEPVTNQVLISRSTQTDASSFNYKIKRKAEEIEIETIRIVEKSISVENIATQTEWSHFADKLIEQPKQAVKSNYNLRNRSKK